MDNAAIEDMFAGLGRVTIKRMFGGKGIYFEGRILALEVGGDVLLKADAESAPEFEAASCRQWTYDGKGKPVKMPYWSVPDAAFDDPDEMTRWVELAWQAALRSTK